MDVPAFRNFNNISRPSQVRAALIEMQCLKLRTLGHDYDSIADQMGITRALASRAVNRGLKAMKAEIREKASEVIDIELYRLDVMLLAIMPAASTGNLDAQNGVLKLMERRAKYLALDSAAKLPPAPPAAAIDLAKLTLEELGRLEELTAKSLLGDVGEDGPPENLAELVDYGAAATTGI